MWRTATAASSNHPPLCQNKQFHRKLSTKEAAPAAAAAGGRRLEKCWASVHFAAWRAYMHWRVRRASRWTPEHRAAAANYRAIATTGWLRARRRSGMGPQAPKARSGLAHHPLDNAHNVIHLRQRTSTVSWHEVTDS